MEQNNTITIAVWLEKSQSLLNKIEKLFKEIDVDTSDLPKSVYDSNTLLVWFLPDNTVPENQLF